MGGFPEQLSTTLSDRYQVERLLGAGGMAQVYLARDLRHDRQVALKVLRPELGAILGSQRFLAEIRTTAQLVHSHILPLLDSGENGGFLWYTMPYVQGMSLRGRLEQETQLPIGEAVQLAREVALALDAAHRRGIIHRDIKPENILLQDGTALVADFGIALALREAGGARLTESGLSLGTPQYMSPEQASGGRQVDARTDIYSLGAVLYEMLAGEAPHTGPTVQSIIAKLMTENPVAIRTVRSTVSPALAAVVHRCLAKSPADRLTSAGELARALAEPGLATVGTDATTVPTSRRRSRFPIAAGLLGGVVIAAAAGIALWRRDGIPREPFLPPGNRATPIQLTVEGNATFPALSADGERVAMSLRLCDSLGACREEIEIRDLNGPGRLRLPGSYDYLMNLDYSNDGRWLLIQAFKDGQVGMFLVPALGGEPRRLPESYASFLGAGDTLIASPSIPTIRQEGSPVAVLRTTVDLVVRDSISFPDLKGGALCLGSPGGNLINVVTFRTTFQSYIADRSGRLLDTLPLKGIAEARGRWSKRGDAFYQPRRDSADPRLMSVWRIVVDPGTGKVGEHMQPVLLKQASRGRFDVAEANGNMVIDRGQDRHQIVQVTRRRAGFHFRLLRDVTAPFFMTLSPDGRSAAVGTPLPDSSALLSIMDLATGDMRPLARLPRAPAWSSMISLATGDWDRQGQIWLGQPTTDSTSEVLRITVATGAMTTIARLPVLNMNLVSMPGGDLVVFGYPGNRMIRLRQQVQEVFTLPDSLAGVYLARPLNDSTLILGTGTFKTGLYRLDWPTRTVTLLPDPGSSYVAGAAVDGRMVNLAMNTGSGMLRLERLDPWTGVRTKVGELSDQGITAGYVFFDDRMQPAVLFGPRFESDIYLLRGAVDR